MIYVVGLCLVCFGVCLPFYMYYKKSRHLFLGCIYKSIGTCCALIPALVAAIRLDPAGGWFSVAGLALYAVADFCLEYNLWVGAGFFMAGHILQIAFFTKIAPIGSLHVIVLLALFVVAVLCFYRWRKPIGKQLPAFSLYALILCLMCACAVGCCSLNTLQGFMIAVAGALFIVSDFMLLRRTLFPSSRLLSWAILITYYLSLMLIGSSFLL